MKPVIYVVNSQGKNIRITNAVRKEAYELRTMHNNAIDFAKTRGRYTGDPADYDYQDIDIVLQGLSYHEVLEAVHKPL